jgi:D-alanyl-D-alanine carboxypeptidase
MQDSIEGALAVATQPKPAAPIAAPKIELADATVLEEEGLSVETVARATALPTIAATPEVSTIVALSAPPRARPKFSESGDFDGAGDSDDLELAASVNTPKARPQVITRTSTSGGRHWGVNLGKFASHSAAERTLMKTMLTESATLQDGLRKIVKRSNGFDANFMGLTQEQADLACRRLQARATQCFTIGPS